MLHVRTPKAPTTAPVKMDLKATGNTAWVRFCLRASQQTAFRRRDQRKETQAVNVYNLL